MISICEEQFWCKQCPCYFFSSTPQTMIFYASSSSPSSTGSSHRSQTWCLRMSHSSHNDNEAPDVYIIVTTTRLTDSDVCQRWWAAIQVCELFMSYFLNWDFIRVCKCFSQCREVIEKVKQQQIEKNMINSQYSKDTNKYLYLYINT